MDVGVHLQVFKCDFKVVRGSCRLCMVSHGMGLNTCFPFLCTRVWGREWGDGGWPMSLVYKFNPIQNFHTPE